MGAGAGAVGTEFKVRMLFAVMLVPMCCLMTGSWILAAGVRPKLTIPVPSSRAPADLPLVYKDAILFFRSVFAFTRALPAYALGRRLARRVDGGGVGLRIGTRMRAGGETAGEAAGPGLAEGQAEIDVGERVGEGGMPVAETTRFPELVTPYG